MWLASLDERHGGAQPACTTADKGWAPPRPDARAGEGGFIDRWMSQIEESAQAIAQKHSSSPEAHRLLEEAAIRQSMATFRSFPFVAESEQKRSLVVLGCHFSIQKGNCGYWTKPKEISALFRRVASQHVEGQ